MTVFSGVSLPGVTGGHAAEKCFLTGTPHPERGGFRNWVSLDQFAAEQIGNRTRYPSLVLAMSNEGPDAQLHPQRRPDPAERSPKKLFQKLFVQGKPEEVAANVEALRQGRSMLDFVGEQSKRLNRSLSTGRPAAAGPVLHLGPRAGAAAAQLRGLGAQAEAVGRRAKPPEDIDDAREFVRKTRLMFDVMKLALETDSSRLISLFIDTTVIHNITHHGNRPEVLAELRAQGRGAVRRARRLPHRAGRDEGRRPVAARPHDGALRHLHGQRELALERQPAGAARRRRLQARPAPGVRHDRTTTR